MRSQDTIFVIISVAIGRQGRKLAWEFFKANFPEFLSRYQGGFLIARLVKSITGNFASEEMAVEVDSFFKKHKFPGTERTVQQSLESVRRNAAWLKRDGAVIKQFLDSL